MTLETFKNINGWAILVLQIITIIGFVNLFIIRRDNCYLQNFFKKRGELLILLVVFFSAVASLIFSDIYHFEPCKLCWLQRVFLYPQFIIVLVSLWKKDKHGWMYTFWLSLVGMSIALYQMIEQFRILKLPQASCVIGPDAACSQIYMMEFGYITLPVASLTVFAFIIVLSLIQRKKQS